MDGSQLSWTRRAEHEKGQEAERLFHEAFYKYSVALPAWLYKVERATALEDSDGIDAWAYTDQGCIPIQIKSSARGAAIYRERHPNCQVITLVVSCSDTPRAIRDKTIKNLENYFRHLQKIKRVQRRTARY